MATKQEYIYDLKRLLTKGGITDESRLNNNHLGFLLDQRRAKEIRDSYKRNPVIEPVWIQDYGIFELTPVTKEEDKSILSCDCKFSKAVLPGIVSLMDPISNTSDLGVYSIRSSCGTYLYHQMSPAKMPLLHSDSIMSKIKYFTRVGNAIYLTPVVKKARAFLILDNPLDGYVLDNVYVNSGDLTVGTVYAVASGNITHNSIKYQIGQTFTAVNKVFIGLGKVQYNNQKRRMTVNDQYPMSHTMAEVIKMKILTQDFGIEANVVADLKNDSQDDASKR
jgi:hypothetical protein